MLDAEDTEKQEEQKKSNTHFWGGLENGQEVVPPFFAQEGFFKILKAPILIAFPEKWVAATFF